jgi:glyoxylase-like metal-dependent hydrolase (beta-lactamase superfamily II)
MKVLTPILAIIISLNTAMAQINADEIMIKPTAVAENMYLLEGRGGNILLAVGDEEALMIDSQFAPLSDKIKITIDSITSKPISYLVNTHHHGDHTGGNENFNTDAVTVIAQSNVLKRLEDADKPQGFLPEITLDEELKLKMADENVLIMHVHNAHTDGDSFIYFTKANVVHMGDVFFNGRYPYIDLNSGGSINGYIDAQMQVLETINEQTVIVPGHGKVAGYKDLQMHVSMLKDLRNSIQFAIDRDRTKSQIIADETITQAYDALGYGDGFINSQKIRETIYNSLMSDK